MLEIAYQREIDVLCIQEPATYPGSRTSNHPGYSTHAPIEAWGNAQSLEAERPRVMTYVRKDAGLEVRPKQPLQSRDMVWTKVNGYSILNVYRQPKTPTVIDYVTSLSPPSRCIVGGDFNAKHETFEPGIQSLRGGKELAQWALASGMDYIGEAGVATHKAGHVIDLTFSNIPFAKTEVRSDMHCGSDHEALVTLLPGRGQSRQEQLHYRIPEANLPRFAGLVEIGMAQVPNLQNAIHTSQVENCVLAITTVLKDAIRISGKASRSKGRSAPWWTDKCKEMYQRHIYSRKENNRSSPSIETREFLSTVRQAKRAYWRNIIDGVKSDKELYRVINWHKLEPTQQDTALVIDGRTITDPAEKAEALRESILSRFSSKDDLPAHLELHSLTQAHSQLVLAGRPSPALAATLPWNTSISIEEVERNVIGIGNTSPGPDQITVRVLKACWTHIKQTVRDIYQQCLQLCYFPTAWKLAEVVMLPKTGKRDKTSPRAWRPIALLSCLGKGLERIVARRLAWTALTSNILSPQHGGAMPKRSATDLAAALTHDIELALSRQKTVTVITMDVLGAFDALLKNRLLQRMHKQGWQDKTVLFINSFLTNRKVRVRLGKEITPETEVQCGTPQGSPLSPVLYTLYLAELLTQDKTLRFGYADDICIYRATDTLDNNVQLLAADVRRIIDWGVQNKVQFAPEKLEMIHITRQRNTYAPSCTIDENLIIRPITAEKDSNEQPALRWLGVWFDRRLTFKHHVAVRASKARRVAHHIRSLGRTAHGPPASSLRKAVITCTLPSLLYGSEVWYGGRTRLNVQEKQTSAKVGWHISVIEKTIMLAARGVLPAWRTTPNTAILRETGLPSGIAALEEAKLRFALHLQAVDAAHPLAKRSKTDTILQGLKIGQPQRPRTKVQIVGRILPEAPRPILAAPHYSEGCRTDPTNGQDKETAAKAFKTWWALLPETTITVFSDGSEQTIEGVKRVTYGFTIYQGSRKKLTGSGSLNPQSHVFDAEAVGAWRGLQQAILLQTITHSAEVWLCIDSTSVIWCLRGNASPSSQWAFLNCHRAMEQNKVQIKWAPGHSNITGNEEADYLANVEAHNPQIPTGEAAYPTISGIKTSARCLLRAAQQEWWRKRKAELSSWYRQWNLPYAVKELPELKLSRRILARLVALRTKHGDFAWYHKKFQHEDANLKCSCKMDKTPDHIVHCRKTVGLFHAWPLQPFKPPSNSSEGIQYLKEITQNPKDFESLLKLTEFYSAICP